LGHPEKYINFCRNLWPKSGHRADITVLDTYFNEKSEDAARIATGCLLEGIDKLMEGKWENGFAVIRPPGHHSGGKNTINGFCIYNSVAIGANYIIEKWKKQRVAIIDWDVHHGDGTQHIMQSN
jgi:acetoin utilization deacetylase AcuC-like enzyme